MYIDNQNTGTYIINFALEFNPRTTKKVSKGKMYEFFSLCELDINKLTKCVLEMKGGRVISISEVLYDTPLFFRVMIPVKHSPNQIAFALRRQLAKQIKDTFNSMMEGDNTLEIVFKHHILY